MCFVGLIADVTGDAEVGLLSRSLELEVAHPARYIQETPYAAVTAQGGTTGRKASPTSLVFFW
jgi:hypothetical protein